MPSVDFYITSKFSTWIDQTLAVFRGKLTSPRTKDDGLSLVEICFEG